MFSRCLNLFSRPTGDSSSDWARSGFGAPTARRSRLSARGTVRATSIRFPAKAYCVGLGVAVSFLGSSSGHALGLSLWSGAEPQLASAETASSGPAPAPQPAADDQAAENHPASRILRVAADPNNLPFSNSRLEGFENRIVALLAKELDATVEYTWLPQRRGFFRHTMKEGSCDVVAGVPKGFGRTLTTSPYYKSSYVFLTRSDQKLEIHSFDDPRLRQLQIGVQVIGDDYANTPPAQALADRGMVANVHGYTVFGDYAEEAPLAKIVDAVARGEIDIAVVWGPLAGYYAKHYAGVLALSPLASEDQARPLPVTFDICLGVRRNEPELRDELNAVIAKKRSEIEAILTEYGVPLADASR